MGRRSHNDRLTGLRFLSFIFILFKSRAYIETLPGLQRNTKFFFYIKTVIVQANSTNSTSNIIPIKHRQKPSAQDPNSTQHIWTQHSTDSQNWTHSKTQLTQLVTQRSLSAGEVWQTFVRDPPQPGTDRWHTNSQQQNRTYSARVKHIGQISDSAKTELLQLYGYVVFGCWYHTETRRLWFCWKTCHWTSRTKSTPLRPKDFSCWDCGSRGTVRRLPENRRQLFDTSSASPGKANLELHKKHRNENRHGNDYISEATDTDTESHRTAMIGPRINLNRPVAPGVYWTTNEWGDR